MMTTEARIESGFYFWDFIDLYLYGKANGFAVQNVCLLSENSVIESVLCRVFRAYIHKLRVCVCLFIRSCL